MALPLRRKLGIALIAISAIAFALLAIDSSSLRQEGKTERVEKSWGSYGTTTYEIVSISIEWNYGIPLMACLAAGIYFALPRKRPPGAPPPLPPQ